MTAEQVREALKVEPELLQLADLLRQRFDAKLVWLKTAEFEMGRPPAREVQS